MRNALLLATVGLVSLLFSLNCTPKGAAYYEAGAPDPKAQVAQKPRAPKEAVVYSIYENGSYKPGQLDKEPAPIGGDAAFLRASHVNYPAKAREAGLQGTVWVTVTINEAGQLEQAVLSRGIGGGCDEEALAAVKRGAKVGFEPAMRNGVPVKVRYDMPVRFSVQ